MFNSMKIKDQINKNYRPNQVVSNDVADDMQTRLQQRLTQKANAPQGQAGIDMPQNAQGWGGMNA